MQFRLRPRGFSPGDCAADLSHGFLGNFAAPVAPGGTCVGEDIRDFPVGEKSFVSGHDSVVLLATGFESSLETLQDDFDGYLGWPEEPAGTDKGREGPGQPSAIGLVAGHAREVDLLTAFGPCREVGRGGRWACSSGLGQSLGQFGI